MRLLLPVSCFEKPLVLFRKRLPLEELHLCTLLYLSFALQDDILISWNIKRGK
jgi:hypothetical protein